jgi:uncharacterized protein (DUF1778 family)
MKPPTVSISARYTAEEKEILRRAAALDDRTIAWYTRRAVLRQARVDLAKAPPVV